MSSRQALIGLALVVTVTGWAQAQIYVDRSAIGGGDTGADWPNAYLELQSALDAATSGVEIWVAAGTYLPDYDVGTGLHTGDRAATFQLPDNVGVYGGFNGTEDQLDQRDPAANVTTLSGDLSDDDDPMEFPAGPSYDDNSYHVVASGVGTDDTAILDGFTITGGNADGAVHPDNSGGGMYNYAGSPTVANCTFSGNSGAYIGGAIFNDNGSDPTVTDCVFTQNYAHFGAGIFNLTSSSPTIDRCTFTLNSTGGDAAGVANYAGCNATLTNCTFSDNSAVRFAGAVFNGENSAILTNCTFNNNSADYGGAIYNGDATPALTNCILWGNTSATAGPQIYDDASTSGVSYTCIEGGWTGPGAGPGIIEDNPEFVGGGDLRHQSTSPCIDAGDNAAPGLSGVTTDLDGNPRMMDDPNTPDGGNGTPPIVDMGAYEYWPDCNTNGIPDATDMADCDPNDPACQDCNTNGIPDLCDIYAGTSADVYEDGVPDECQPVDNVTQGTRYVTIQEAINAATGGDELEVGPGTYVELINLLGKAITLRSTDGPAVTIIDGAAAGRVITCASGEGLDTVIEGFTVTNGQEVYGGGMYNVGSPTVITCIFSGNSATTWHGGGIFNDVNATPTFIECSISGNSAVDLGGGMYNNRSNPTLTNCTFSGNSAGGGGGGMYNNNDSSPTVTNCTFSGNSALAGWGGGGMYNSQLSNPTLTNCTFSENSAATGGGFFNYYCTPTLANCILWDNTATTAPQINDSFDATTAATYSCIQGIVWPGAGNIDTDPRFDFALRPIAGSPCIDAGDNTAVPADTHDLDDDGDTTEPIPLDLFGLRRFHDDPLTDDTGVGTPPIVDMGACEHGSAPPPPTLPADLDNDGDVDLDDFALFAQQFTGPQ
ncbi:MAG: hypothetical protein GY778_14610 [bacterium]|nr:hypothetical protein [bacterium]